MSAPDDSAAENSVMIVGRVEVAPADRDAFLESQRAGVEASRAEPGCLRYVVGADLLDDGVVNLFEHWQSRAALADHLAVLKARPAPAGPRVEIRKMTIRQHEAGPAGRVGS